MVLYFNPEWCTTNCEDRLASINSDCPTPYIIPYAKKENISQEDNCT